MKGSNLTHSLAIHRTKDWINTKGELASCIQALPARPPPPSLGGKEAIAGRQGAALISAPEMVSSTKLWAGSQLLTTSSWDPGWLTSTRRVTASDQLPRGDTGHLRQCSHGEPGKPSGRMREVIRSTAHLKRCACQEPGHLSCSDLGRAQNAQPTCSVSLRSTQEPEQLRPGKCRKCRVRSRQRPCRAPWSLSSVDPGSTHGLELRQTLCGPTASTPHTHQ